MQLAGGGARGRGAAPAQYRITANELVYRDKERTASYRGLPATPVVMTGADGVTSAARMVLTLARESRALDRLDAEGEVYLKLTQGQEALADTLVYVAAGEQYTLRGQPVVFRAPGEKAGACSLWKGRVGYWKPAARAPEFPSAENPGGVETRDDASCAGALTR
jgi:lipopolysaccharide export system protein LptA